MAGNTGLNFKTGNICRIYVKNFLTFNEVEVRPKPRLNLIFGRNGSGKSTILSAICLCLGGKAQVLGRSKEVFDFVKIGKTEATLEVEVFVVDQINAVITHKINSSTRRCSWFIQGKEVSYVKAMARIKELNIQVDNLCQFLPQDRVVAFAKMNCQNLLIATEKAVGDPSLFNDHQQLCSSGKKLMTMQDKIKELQVEVAQIERRNARLKDVVDNLEVKQKLEMEIEELKKQQAWDLYDLKRKIHQEHKEKLEEVLKELNELKHKMNPTIEKTRKINAALSEIKKIVQSRTQLVRKSQHANENLKVKSDRIGDKLKDAQRHFATQKAEEQERLAELKDYQRQLDVLQGQLQNLPGLDESEVTHRLEELTQMIKSSSQKVIQLQNDVSDIIHVRDKKKGLIRTRMEELQALQDVKGQRMKLIRSHNKDVYKATQWLQDNRHCFKGIVYPPICAMLNVKNQHYARYVENRVMERDLVAFVCEDKDDVNSLKQEMDRQRLCINIVYANPDHLDRYKPNQPIQELRKYGFETYMLDCLEGPPAILSFLCQNYGLHNVPIGTSGNYDAVPSYISVFYLDTHRYSRIVSRYDRQVSTSIYQVGAAKLLQIVLDQEKINELKADIENLEAQIQEVEEEQRSLRAKEDQLSKNLEVWRNEKRALSSRKEERSMLVQRINHKKNQISEHESNVVDLPAAKAAMNSVVQNCISKQVEIIEKLQAEMKETGELVCGSLCAEGKAKILNIELTSLENSARVWKEKIKDMQEKAAEMKHTLEKQKLEGRDALNNLKHLLGIVNIREITDEMRERFQNSSLEETESKLMDKDAQLSCLITASANEMKEYQEGCKKLAQQREMLQDLERRVETHYIDLSEVKERWLTQLTHLVGDISERFSGFMERMGFAGEVSLIETEENFDNYGMAIKVKFRDEQRLQQLTAQQQSGGERAVSTALYLLALQSLTAAPFRCVDEINQGMDKVNERKILELLMETEGNDDCSQYFFVTPKLQQNQDYKWEVNIMSVLNSPNTLNHRRFAIKRILKRKDDADRRR